MNKEEFITKKYIGKGKCSKCYLLQNGNVFKQFNNPLDISDINRFKYFLNYKNDCFLFPFEFISDNKKFYGYITKKAVGTTIDSVFTKSDLNILASNCKKLEENIKYVSEGKIIMYDFHSNNLMYNEKIFEVIDTDEYSISGIYDVEESKEINLSFYRNLICNLFISNITYNEDTKYIIEKIKEYKKSTISVNEIILNIKDSIEKDYKEEISIVEDINKILIR